MAQRKRNYTARRVEPERPLSELSRAILDLLQEKGPMTSRQVSSWLHIHAPQLRAEGASSNLSYMAEIGYVNSTEQYVGSNLFTYATDRVGPLVCNPEFPLGLAWPVPYRVMCVHAVLTHEAPRA